MYERELEMRRRSGFVIGGWEREEEFRFGWEGRERGTERLLRGWTCRVKEGRTVQK